MANGLNCTSVNAVKNIRDMIFGLDTPIELEDGRTVPAVNLDNAATTPSLKQVVMEIQNQLKYYGSIGRGKGQKSEHSNEIYEKGREIIKGFVGADSDIYTVLYVNNTTDGINKLASALIQNSNDIILSTRMEHHANDLPWRNRGKTLYAEVDRDGRLDIASLERLLISHNGKIKYVTVTAASNVTGYVNDVHLIAKIAHFYGARIIVDGAQIVAHREFHMLGKSPEENIDFLIFSAHKMYSPFGGGAVVGLSELLNKHLPAFYGGGMVEAVDDFRVRYSPEPDRYEAGTPNYPGIVGMIKAVKILKQIGFQYIREHEQFLLKKTLDGLKEMPGVILYGDNDHITDRVGIIVFNLKGMEPDETADMLAGYRGIAVRHAAFCAHPYVRRLTKKEGKESVGGKACQAPRGMVRISFGIYNTAQEVDCFLSAVRQLLSGEYLRASSQGGKLKLRSPNDRG